MNIVKIQFQVLYLKFKPLHTLKTLHQNVGIFKHLYKPFGYTLYWIYKKWQPFIYNLI